VIPEKLNAKVQMRKKHSLFPLERRMLIRLGETN
jgi:hypothetical protein